jgi:hypothetical protein
MLLQQEHLAACRRPRGAAAAGQHAAAHPIGVPGWALQRSHAACDKQTSKHTHATHAPPPQRAGAARSPTRHVSTAPARVAALSKHGDRHGRPKTRCMWPPDRWQAPRRPTLEATAMVTTCSCRHGSMQRQGNSTPCSRSHRSPCIAVGAGIAAAGAGSRQHASATTSQDTNASVAACTMPRGASKASAAPPTGSQVCPAAHGRMPLAAGLRVVMVSRTPPRSCTALFRRRRRILCAVCCVCVGWCTR